MWCKHCAQDVPGVPSLEQGEFSCPRCGDSLPPIQAHGTAPAAPQSSSQAGRRGPEGSQSPVAPLADDWEMDEELRQIERLLEVACGGESPAPDGDAKMLRLDAAHGGPPAAHRGSGRKRRCATSKPHRKMAAPRPERTSALAGLTWSVLSLGTMAFVCGGVLLGWAVFAGRQELWSLGMPIALGGQIALLVGLVLQLDRLWHDNRKAAAKLDDVDEQLHELKKTTTLLGTTHGPSATFYAHMAGGASPQLLLTDLKSQLDLLAIRLSKEEA